ncbi:DUF2244 domain-containing protein [Sabulicella glaciei]|uniref:DUF2244 domain-containing protein n=1 Tax=Sabulicella glaciei TaxID=2984948 RepID=A0ABT3NXD7_9PROT|nr:DUF2244 domain-containing protein [Roseococcus sp. MDT2-1-1]MCW8086835.1 DUF2244 domain-containing protein [Roseococcus sp. MDT2-1-1]
MPHSPALFEARSAPLLSMDERGFRLVAGLLLLGFTFGGTVCTLMGAWPVTVFAGVEVALVILLLATYRTRAATSAELVMLTEGRLLVRRREGRRQMQAEFDPFWARLAWDGEGRLVVRHRARSVEIGRFLPPEEKRALEAGLAAALRRYREPVFDNPQLRDG